MRFLIINADYPEFLRWLYAEHPGLERQPYDEQMKVRNESLFGVADFYSSNLQKLGHEAWDIHANNEFMQKAWAKEQGIQVREPYLITERWRQIFQRTHRLARRALAKYLMSFFRVTSSLDNQPAWFNEILAAQIKKYKPDVLLNQIMGSVDISFLRRVRQCVRLLVGQHAATPLPDSVDWSCYDLVISSFPPTVEWFRQKGIPAEVSGLGFEPSVLSLLEHGGKTIDVTFVGSFRRIHSSRVALLEKLCERFDQIRIWGPDVHHLSPTSPIRRNYVGHAWGREMYQILYNSKITLNHHGDVAPYANNSRLYEATGVGTLLITDWKENLHDLFELDKEVVAYRTAEECAELIQHYLEHDDEREAIAHAGQERTLRDYTYYQRVQELVNIINRYDRLVRA